jgi:hypothetical protein
LVRLQAEYDLATEKMVEVGELAKDNRVRAF